MSENESLDNLVNLAKRRGFVFPASDIYGGLSGFYDFGPYGAQMVRNIRNVWWKRFVEDAPNIYGLDSAIIQHPDLWRASGHVNGFNDPMTTCGQCNSRLRADHVVGLDSDDLEKLNKKLADAKCPICGTEDEFSEAQTFNMMFKTYVGPTEGEDSLSYLRPETAGPIFAQFRNLEQTARAKLPFGVAQIGKAFRNEISPRNFLFRLREMEQMEIEYFVRPEQAAQELENWREICWQWLLEIGIGEDNLEWHQHTEDERAHYAEDAWDIQYKYPFGTKELWGIANRTDYDLKHHAEESGKSLDYYDQENEEKLVPYVVEPSVGVERLFLALLDNAYREEEVPSPESNGSGDGEERVVLKLDPQIAPVQVAVFPLVRNDDEVVELAQQVYQQLKEANLGVVEYDESGSIGKRYRRQDEIGTPLAVTIDFDSLDDKQVTIRDRDTMKQKRVDVDDLPQIVKQDIRSKK